MDLSYLDNPIWHSLNSGHRAMATIQGSAARYQSDVSVLVGLRDGTEKSFDDLAVLFTKATGGGTFTNYPLTVPPGWDVKQRMIDQMICTDLTAYTTDGIKPLGASDVPHMLALTAATEPGPFAAGTITMGRYFGIWSKDGRLAAMAGQRLALDGFTEISAVCTDPDFRGRGYARSLVTMIAAQILADGKVPFLHVKTENEARFVYQKAGFKVRAPIHLTVIIKA